MEFPVAVLSLGLLLLLIGLIGGDLSYRGFTIPKVGPLPRFTTTIGGIACIGLSVLLFAGELAVTYPGASAAGSSDVQPSVNTETETESQSSAWITVTDELSYDFQLAESVYVYLGTDFVGQLYVDLGRPVATLDVEIQSAGEYDYWVEGEYEGLDGYIYTLNGGGTVYLEEGSAMYLALDDSGQLTLTG